MKVLKQISAQNGLMKTIELHCLHIQAIDQNIHVHVRIELQTTCARKSADS